MKKVFQILSVVLMSAISVSAMAADAADVLSKLKSRIAPDKRTAIFDVKSTTAGKQVTVTGTVGFQEQKDAISKELADNGFTNVQNKVNVAALQNDDCHKFFYRTDYAMLQKSSRHTPLYCHIHFSVHSLADIQELIQEFIRPFGHVENLLLLFEILLVPVGEIYF